MLEDVHVRLMINGEPHHIETARPLTVAGLLAHLGLDQRFGAVEVNREVVPKSQHGAHALNEGDQVEIIRFVGGG